MGGRRDLPTPTVTRLPTQDSSLVRDTRASARADIQGRGGRQSTILSDLLKQLTGSKGLLGA